MSGNSLGKKLVLTTFGESHGAAIGGVLDGFPAGTGIDLEFIRKEINRRNPSNYPFATPRREEDILEILSGVYENLSTGTPIGFICHNKNQKPAEYEHLKDLYRPSHADYTYEKRYGIRDYRGGGRSSARTTLALVAGGAFAKLLLQRFGISISGYVSRIGPCALAEGFELNHPDEILNSPLNCPDNQITADMIHFLEKVQKDGDTAGGVVSIVVKDVPPGLGDPLMDKLSADLAKAMFIINAVKGFEIGSGFKASEMKGSEHNDPFVSADRKIVTLTNHSGGIQGGLSNGMDIHFNVAFKPVSSLGMKQTTVDHQGKQVHFEGKGRHDVCVVPRAVPIVEAMTALVIADHYLRQRPVPVD